MINRPIITKMSVPVATPLDWNPIRLEQGLPRLRSLPSRLGQICVIALIFISVTAPPLVISGNLPYVKAEQLLLPVIFLLYTWFLLAGYARPIRFNGMFIVGILCCCSITISMWYGSSILGHTVLIRDFYELPKVWLPVIFFTVTYEAELSESSLRRLLDFFAVAVLLVCFYAWAQFFNLGIKDYLDAHYSGGKHIDDSLEYARRVYSTMGNPNVLGQLMTWSIIAYTMAAIFRAGKRWRNVTVALACLITLGMTGSRYGLITTTLGLILIFAMPSFSRRRRMGQLGLLLILLPVFVWIFAAVASSNQRTLERFESLRHPLQVDSLRDRLDNLWRDALSDFARSPIVGHGPAKTLYTGVVTDSEYLDALKEYGIVGFLTFIAYYLFPGFLLWKGLRASRRVAPWLEACAPATFMTLCLCFVMVITALVMAFGESTFHNQLLQGFFWMWMGIGARSAKKVADASRAGHSFPV